MSNTLMSLTSNPIIVDSRMEKPWRASVIDSLATLVARRKIVAAPIFVRKVFWEGGADGDILSITDGLSVPLLTLVGKSGVPQTVDFCSSRWKDFQVTQISSGTLSIFLGQKTSQENGTETADDSAFEVLVTDAATRQFQEYQSAAPFCLWCRLRAWISRR
jgi:hypothetical protein